MLNRNHLLLPRFEVTDDLGTYVNFNRVCQFPKCAVALTSRNRYGHRLYCKPCAVAKTIVKAIAKRGKEGDPQRQEVIALLDAFLIRPAYEPVKAALLSKLVDIELKFRFRYISESNP